MNEDKEILKIRAELHKSLIINDLIFGFGLIALITVSLIVLI